MTTIGLDIAGRRIGARPPGRSLMALGWACLESTVAGRSEHRPTGELYAEDVIRRVSFEAGGDLGWRISALNTPRPKPAPWKIVVVTGAPSWAEYWAPVLAALPADREMVVVDRPGYGLSEPDRPVPDIQIQARALAPLLRVAQGQRLLLVGQSYGAAISVLMAAERPEGLAGLVLLSSYLGQSGPTARWLVETGARLSGVIPRDLKTAVTEVSGQAAQLSPVRAALSWLDLPIHVIHGEADDFAPIELAQRLAEETVTRHAIRFQAVAGAGHFLTDGPPEVLLARFEACLPRPAPSPTARARAWFRRTARRLSLPRRSVSAAA